jgi:hypothetical protein
MSDGVDRFLFAATIDEQGVIRPDRVNETKGRLVKWKGRHCTVTVSRYVKPKTNPQLALFFGLHAGPRVGDAHLEMPGLKLTTAQYLTPGDVSIRRMYTNARRTGSPVTALVTWPLIEHESSGLA